MIKVGFGITLGFVALQVLLPSVSRAAGVSQVVPMCGVVGNATALAGYEGTNAVDGKGPTFSGPSSFFGGADAALGYGCANWMVQIDGAWNGTPAYGVTNLGGSTGTASDGRGHIGGVAFLRDASLGRIGIAGSEIFDGTGNSSGGAGLYAGSLTRLGGFGEYYVNDKFTLGAGAFYDSGVPYYVTYPNQPLSFSGFDGYLSAKFYPNNRLSLSLRGDMQSASSSWPSGGAGATVPDQYSGFAATAEVEYLFEGNNLSVLGGARYAGRLDATNWGPQGRTFYDEQAYVGVKFAFGGSDPTSLQARDRNGTYDNTSVMFEKLPNLNYDEKISGAH